MRSRRTAVLVAAVAVCAGAVPAACAPEPRAVPDACPQRWGGEGIGGWVPAAVDVDGADETLVPGSPVRALICAYPGVNMDPGGERLAGSRTLTDQAAAMARDLAYLPVTTEDADGLCTAMGGPMTNYLVRFAYADGSALWVGSAEEVNSCVSTTNGTVRTRSYVGKALTAAYREGTWRISRPDDPCRGGGDRRGQQDSMIPGDPRWVLVCRGGNVKWPPRREHGVAAARELAAALNDLDTVPSDRTCRGRGASAVGDDYRLVFGYEEGPPAGVHIRYGCTPSVDNGMLQADVDDDVRRLMARLVP
ncbi:hypothetical protein [Microbispora sp. NBRC 16548]|uniref:hypothetical protein n=1 Tax=Microbispora sp. NBRC 16548 TaxID=3030994 RepID=UPI0024A38263|nr:hypothetical protein [Microbispora sp. NBRC 16548]GLX10745.1 hypothetical protein Misp03_76710 [Microbispora sp. NBRC 16548]